MRTRSLVLGVLAVVLIGIAAVLLLNRLQPSERHPAAAHTSISETPVDLKSVVIVPPVTSTPTPRESPAAEAIEQGTKIVRVRPDQVLATVNGVAITLRNLAPVDLAEASSEQVMSTEIYEFLLGRAIERELTFQAARERGVELTEEQQQQLAQRREQLERQDPQLIRQMTMNPAAIEFDLRDTAGLMLQANLAAQAGLPSPYVTPAQVEQYYQNHKAEYGELPSESAERQTAWQKIDRDIRQKLTPRLQAEYQQALDKLLDQLKASAQVTVTALAK